MENSRQHRVQLRSLSQRILAGRRLIVASNRGPVEFSRTREGDIRGRRGSGGLVTAVSAIGRLAHRVVWVASAMTAEDREMAARAAGQPIRGSGRDEGLRLRFVVTPPEAYHQYYEVISNPLLWFLHHYLWDAPRAPNITDEIWRAWEDGYKQVNHAFAQAILEELARDRSPALVMLQDYHLYLCPGYLRRQLPRGTTLQQFVHIPWPGPTYWEMLPPPMRQAIFSSLCSNDILGFHTDSYVLNFLRTCESHLPGARVDYRARTVALGRRVVRVRAYPISIDVVALRDFSRSLAVQRQQDRLREHLGEQTIVRIDRLEPSKNILRGFAAFRRLLERHPRYRGRLKFLAFLVPSRLGVEEYQRYLEEILVAGEWINVHLGDEEWKPVDIFVGDNYARAVAAMQLYDVLLVNPIIDGMNLVAKEGPVVNQQDGVLVLSEGAGAHEQLREGALIVSAYDIVGTSRALQRALEMGPAERRRREAILRRQVEAEDITRWLYHQLVDLQELIEAKA